VVLGALGFIGAAGGFLFARRLFPRRSLEFVILGVSFVATGALFAWALYRAKDVLLELGRGPRVVAALLLPLVAAGVAKLLANGLLSLAIRLTRLTPRERLVSRRTILSVLGGALGCLIVVALAWPGRERAASPPSLPMAPGRPVGSFSVSIRIGSPANLESASSRRKVSSPRHPLPMCSCRSTRLPHGRFESLPWKTTRRGRPTMRSKASNVSRYPCSLTMS
jgi:hypothetical protein